MEVAVKEAFAAKLLLSVASSRFMDWAEQMCAEWPAPCWGRAAHCLRPLLAQGGGVPASAQRSEMRWESPRFHHSGQQPPLDAGKSANGFPLWLLFFFHESVLFIRKLGDAFISMIENIATFPYVKSLHVEVEKCKRTN